MSDQRPDNPFDAMRRVINHEANQDDDGGFFAQLGGIEQDHDDGPTARELFQHLGPDETAKLGRRLDDALAQYQPRPVWADKGGKLPAGVDYFHNLLSTPGPFMRLLKRKRQRTCKVWKPKTATRISRIEGLDHTWRTNPWEWRCRKCPASGSKPSWETAYQSATHHARNHHGR